MHRPLNLNLIEVENPQRGLIVRWQARLCNGKRGCGERSTIAVHFQNNYFIIMGLFLIKLLLFFTGLGISIYYLYRALRAMLKN
jgi:hypothetical protein